MHSQIPVFVSILFLIVISVLLAKKIRVAYPIVLVLMGLGLCFVPGMPAISIEPDLIFLLFLPPLLFEAGFSISLKELKKWWRIIGSFAFLVVFFTAVVVAVMVNHFIPGFSLPLGLLLGGIVSPPDAVSAGAILKFVKVPKSTSSILEGESLLNDASSLIIVRFALIIVATGQFIWQDAALDFLWMAVGGAGIGLALAFVFEKINKVLPTDAPADIALSLIYPYLMYWLAEEFHASGVLSVVFGSLFLSAKRYHYLNASSRIASFNVWESVVYVLNGLVFVLIGLAMPSVVQGLRQEGIPFWDAVGYGVAVTAILILVRIISSYIALLTTMLFRRQALGNNFRWKNSWRMPIILGWTGMRGVVSLAAALAVPAQLADGEPFPFRNLILFITFTVILLTLIVQGLTLPWLIEKIGVFDFGQNDERDRRALKTGLVEFCLNEGRKRFGNDADKNLALRRTLEAWEEKLANPERQFLTPAQRQQYLDFLNLQRNYLIEQNKNPNLNEDLIRNHQQLLDLEEERIIHTHYQ